MIKSIDHSQIIPEQYSRPQRIDVSHDINHIIVFYYQQFLQKYLSLVCSDLKSCYDWIVQSATSLALQFLSITLPEIISMIDTVSRMSHLVRTTCGDFNITYGSNIITSEFKHFMMVIFRGNALNLKLGWL